MTVQKHMPITRTHAEESGIRLYTRDRQLTFWEPEGGKKTPRETAEERSRKSFEDLVMAGSKSTRRAFDDLQSAIGGRGGTNVQESLAHLRETMDMRESYLRGVVIPFEDFLRTVETAKSLNDVMVTTERFVREQIRAERVVIRLFEREGDEFIVGDMFYDKRGLNPKQIEVLSRRIGNSTPLMKLAMEEGFLSVDDVGKASKAGYISDDMRGVFPTLDKMHIQVLGDEGMITAYRRTMTFTHNEVMLIGAVARHVSGLIVRAKMSERDPFLTDLYSHGQAEKQVTAAIEGTIRAKGSMCLTAWDIDYFRVVNNTHGHDVGDVILTEVAKTMTSSVRPTDKVIRAGGEEIWTVLSGAIIGDGLKKSHSIRTKIKGGVYADSNTQGATTGVPGGLRITISGGVSEFRVDEKGKAILDGVVIKELGDVVEKMKNPQTRDQTLSTIYTMLTKRADNAERFTKGAGRNGITHMVDGNFVYAGDPIETPGAPR